MESPLRPSPGIALREDAPLGGSAPAITDERGIGAPIEEQSPGPRARRGGALGALVAFAVLVFSYGKWLVLLLPKLKFATTGLSMLVSVAAYALLFTWKFAIGLVLLLLIHEMGHVLQLRREGIRASAPMFIPFLGAAVMMKELPRDAAAEARVGLAGPILGTIGCLVPLGLYAATGSALYLALTFTGLFLNLFNLVPSLPFDGGRAAQALSPWFTYVGVFVFGALAFSIANPILLLMLVLAVMETYRRFKQRKTPEAQRYQEVSAGGRALIAGVYLALILVLVLGMQATYVPAEIGGEL